MVLTLGLHLINASSFTLLLMDDKASDSLLPLSKPFLAIGLNFQKKKEKRKLWLKFYGI